MTLQASGQIDMSDLNVELGLAGTTQIGLGQASCRTLSGVASGQIALGASFYGKSNFTVTNPTPGGSVESDAIHPSTASAQLHVNRAGDIDAVTGVDSSWGSPTGGTPGDTKYVLFTQVSGSGPTAGSTALGVWTQLNVNRPIYMARTGVGTRTGVISVSIANDASGTGATTAGNWTLTAIVESV